MVPVVEELRNLLSPGASRALAAGLEVDPFSVEFQAFLFKFSIPNSRQVACGAGLKSGIRLGRPSGTGSSLALSQR